MAQRNKGQFQKGTHWRVRKPFWNKDWLESEYVAKGRSSADIAADFGLGDSTILYWLKKHGIRTRTIAEARQIKQWGLHGEANGMHGRTGSTNPNWKGGGSPDRQSEYSRSDVRVFLKSIRDRDVCCVHCSASGKLHVHHIQSFTAVPALRYDAANCVSLCVICHRWVHSRANIERKFLKGGQSNVLD